MPTLMDPSTYYSKEAYDSRRIPDQAAASTRSTLHKLIGTRLPWGNAQEVIPGSLFQDPTPETMRFWEKWEMEKNEMKASGTYMPRPLEDVELHIKHNHEVFRHAQLPFRSQFWLFLRGAGKWTTIILIPILILAHMTVMSASDQSAWGFTIHLFINFYSWALGLPLICWATGHIVITRFPTIWFRPPPGPKWEFNRRTGMVRIFNERNTVDKSEAVEFEAPFTEFDAYIITSPDRQGLAMNGLSLAHRYSGAGINFNDLITPDNTTQQPCALWDFLQNYMDISRPLPDITMLEASRHLDPVSIAHDKKNGRKPRYWIDMADNEFKEKVADLLVRIDAIDTFSRSNLMANHVKYTD
ncbi:hypothetical protein [Pseudomonas sp. EA_5y_Pfl2_R50]|uniref:hypothetical protein n=1 Tax=Pseudomonas sp. EA_5y_Pfl2_R50 TaxID=3088691 RepID=UPI0030DD981D